MDFHEIERQFVALAETAGEAIMEIFDSGDAETDWKDDGTPVTLADKRADTIIRKGLEKAFPGFPVVSEETPESHVSAHAAFFIVDPLDGTRGFRRGEPDFTVNIALVEAGVPIAGAVFAPVLQRLFVTVPGGGLVEKQGARKTVHSPRQPVKRNLRAIASRSRSGRPWLERFLSGFDVASVEYMSSSLKFCLIAAGEADLYPRNGPTMEWDTAAGHAVLRAIGGDVVRLDAFDTLPYGKRGYLNPGFVAFAPGIELQER